ncbi:hypothetical protein PAXINDRAFT_172628 [Paxillus involutus ATCC 200175]|uniref:Uncharacterized protein n=1 Tax=Paxillus involutus ATCC 200175 TaxID=664439 RepID=A0A0C9TMV1_PAXIN|nr:hypothetical protein PAXINDRAFT_172628 [Paxillus involutus ATCC 200175]
MTTPSHKSAEPQHGGRSPVDAPYQMSSSGHVMPYTPPCLIGLRGLITLQYQSGGLSTENILDQPNADDPDQPGELTVDYKGPRFAPMSTHGVLRYSRHKHPDVIRRPTEADHTISAMVYEFPETQGLVPPGWTAHRHPEGALYFMHVESKTFTEVNVCNEEICDDIEYFKRFLFSELQDEIEKRGLSGSLKHDEVQLVLEPKMDVDGLLCSYYFVNPWSRCLFWLDDWEGEEIFSDCRGDLSLPHKGLGIQSHYWRHWNLFPNLCNITPELKNEVVDMILHAISDHLTSNWSTCPLNVEELKNHLFLIEKISPNPTYSGGHSAIVIGRIMHPFYHAFFLNFHGEACARLTFDQTIHGWRYHPSLLMATCAPLFFMAPVTSVRSLHKIFVDEIASKEQWNKFLNKLNSQLQDTNLIATVLLNANVGFLAIQSVDNGGGTTLKQLASYLSLVASMGSMVLGVAFLEHTRIRSDATFAAAKHLYRLRHKRHGLETLGIIYSLPYALLMWAMVLFFVAFVSEWSGPANVSSWTSVGSFIFIVTLLVAWCIWTSREQTGYWWFQPDPDQVELEDLEEDDGASYIPRFGFLRRLIPPSWILN